MAGPTSTGFVSKTVADLVTDLNAAWRRVFGAIVNVDPRSRNGQEIGIFASALSDGWNLAEAVAHGFDPNAATGVLLDNLCALTGTIRRAATASAIANLALTGTNGTVIGVGNQVGVPGTSYAFATTGSVTLATAPNWTTTFVYAALSKVKSGGSVWINYLAGTSGGVAPTGAGPTFNDGVITWTRLGAGAAVALAPASCTVNGPVPAYAGTATTILTPVAGWSSAYNLQDATLGNNTELDPALRVRRAQEIQGIGSAQVDAIRAQLARLSGVVVVKAFENTTDVTVDGMPPHSLEYLVEGGDSVVIGQKIFDTKAGGIETTGNTTKIATDSEGGSWTVKFSRPVDVNAWVGVSLVIDPEAFPIDGLDQVKAAIATFGNTQGLGRDIVPSVLQAAAFPIYDANGVLVRGIPGVLDVFAVTTVGTSNPPLSTTAIVLAIRERGLYDTTRVVVATQAGAP